MARRTAIRSSPPRTNGCMIPVTPKAPASRRFSMSSSVSAGAGSSRPTMARLLREQRVPPRTTRQSPLFASSTRSSSTPSSSRISSPPTRFGITHSGTGKSSPRTAMLPSFISTGLPSLPMRSSGPCKSMIRSGVTPSAFAAACIVSTQLLLSSSVPWERFSRMPAMPSRNILPSVSFSAHAGPSVA